MLTSVVVFISRIGKAKIIAKLNTSKNFKKQNSSLLILNTRKKYIEISLFTSMVG